MGANINISGFFIIFSLYKTPCISKTRENKRKIKRKEEKENKTRIKFEPHYTLECFRLSAYGCKYKYQ